MRRVFLKELPDESGYEIIIDQALVATVRNDELDISCKALDPLWEKLDVEMVFVPLATEFPENSSS